MAIMRVQPALYFGENALATVIDRDDVSRSFGDHQFFVARSQLVQRKLADTK